MLIRDVLGRWNLWAQPRRVICYNLLTEAAVVAITSKLLPATTFDRTTWSLFAVLLGVGILQAELGRQTERVRRRMSGTPHINMTSVWTFAGVLVLPPALTAFLVAVLYLHLALRSWYRLKRVSPYRTVSNASVIMLSCYAARWTLDLAGTPGMSAAVDRGWAGVPAVVLAAAVFFVVNAVLVLPARARVGRTPAALFGSRADNGLELATLCLGALNALALVTLPGLAVLVLPPLLILHRMVLFKQLEAATHRDEKTGLFNTAGWHRLATRELSRASRTPESSFGVLMIDLDHFKRINDTHGHLAGDVVLRSAAAAITAAVRDYDSVGRFGGEEFVVLLPDIRAADVRTVAERVRESVAALAVAADTSTITGLTASIGVATYPDAGSAVDRLLHAADRALYNAKNSGRNKVVCIADVG